MSNGTGISHDINEYVPYVGMTGIYELKSPYTKLLDPTLEYTCISVINISGYMSNGNDPLKDIYLANGDTEDNFKSDLEKNRCLLVLQSGKGTKVTVPNSAVATVPNGDGIRYVSKMLGIHLAILPEYIDLSTLKEDISNTVYKHIGVKNKVYETVVGGSIVVSNDKHERIDISRKVIVSENTTPELEVIELKKANLELRVKLTMLEEYIKNKLI